VFPVLVHNQCSDFELISPVYFGHNAIWIRLPDQKVNSNTTTKASFGRGVNDHEFANALIYKLHKKKYIESNDQSNKDSTFTKNSSTSLQLLIIWKYNEHILCVRALLIKHSNAIIWNEDTLEKLYFMHLPLCKDDDITKDTWLLDDATVLMTTSRWKRDSRAFEITISEETRRDETMEPLWVSSNM
jgi:hypothetical protein